MGMCYSGSFLYSWDGGDNIWMNTLWEDTIVLYIHYQQPPDDIDNRPSFPLTYKNQPYADYTVSLSKSSYTDSCKP